MYSEQYVNEEFTDTHMHFDYFFNGVFYFKGNHLQHEVRTQFRYTEEFGRWFQVSSDKPLRLSFVDQWSVVKIKDPSGELIFNWKSENE